MGHESQLPPKRGQTYLIPAADSLPTNIPNSTQPLNPASVQIANIRQQQHAFNSKLDGHIKQLHELTAPMKQPGESEFQHDIQLMSLLVRSVAPYLSDGHQPALLLNSAFSTSLATGLRNIAAHLDSYYAGNNQHPNIFNSTQYLNRASVQNANIRRQQQRFFNSKLDVYMKQLHELT
eukprot:86815_1